VHHLILPVFCLALPILASWSESRQRLQVTASISLSSDLLNRETWQNPDLLPISGTACPQPRAFHIRALLGTVLSGSLVLEIIFAWPGLGQTTYDALFNNDLFLLVGCVAGSSILLITGNLVSDLLILALDPAPGTPSKE